MVLEVKNLVKRYRETMALDHFSMELKEGEILGLLGPNGCGKTTAINCILSLLSFDKGEIVIFGKEMSPTQYSIKRNIGIVPQEVAVFEKLTVQENIDYFAGLYIEDREKRRPATEEAIEFVGLSDYRKYFPDKLSGGLKRRLNIACGIVHKPKLIILDEPTVAVDAQSRNFILEGIKKLNLEGASVLYTTHYLEEAEEICQRIVIMDRGRNVAQGTVEELKNLITTREIIVVDFMNLSPEAFQDIKNIPHLEEYVRKEDGIELSFEKGSNNLSNLIEFIGKHGLSYQKLYSKQPSLNEIFLALTGKELRD